MSLKRVTRSNIMSIDEKIITKVNYAGVKTRRVKCPTGYKLNDTGTSCIPITGSEKAERRMALRKAIRTKRAKGAAFKRRVARKKLRAMKKRKQFGL